jgi:NAD(P)-dependent dehydrogenase (short-subunit alcohol dehydrogenase family)
LPPTSRQAQPRRRRTRSLLHHGRSVAVITGAGSGIGRASALALLAGGWSVALAGRRKEALEETAGMATGGNSLAVPTDVTDPDQVDRAVRRGQGKVRPRGHAVQQRRRQRASTNFGDFTWEMWTKVVAVNLNAMFLCANAAFRMMRDQTPQGGRIINNGSISAHVPRPGSAAYTTTKHAVTGLTKSIALDGRQFDICCGQIDIGNAATPMTARSTNGQMQPYGQMAVEARMDVNHVGAQVAFMANLPLESNVQFVTIMATKMPFIGRHEAAVEHRFSSAGSLPARRDRTQSLKRTCSSSSSAWRNTTSSGRSGLNGSSRALFTPAVYIRRSTPTRAIRSVRPKPPPRTPIDPTMLIGLAWITSAAQASQ